jgi:hypothetical protein
MPGPNSSVVCPGFSVVKGNSALPSQSHLQICFQRVADACIRSFGFPIARWIVPASATSNLALCGPIWKRGNFLLIRSVGCCPYSPMPME